MCGAVQMDPGAVCCTPAGGDAQLRTRLDDLLQGAIGDAHSRTLMVDVLQKAGGYVHLRSRLDDLLQ